MTRRREVSARYLYNYSQLPASFCKINNQRFSLSPRIISSSILTPIVPVSRSPLVIRFSKHDGPISEPHGSFPDPVLPVQTRLRAQTQCCLHANGSGTASLWTACGLPTGSLHCTSILAATADAAGILHSSKSHDTQWISAVDSLGTRTKGDDRPPGTHGPRAVLQHAFSTYALSFCLSKHGQQPTSNKCSANANAQSHLLQPSHRAQQRRSAGPELHPARQLGRTNS